MFRKKITPDTVANAESATGYFNSYIHLSPNGLFYFSDSLSYNFKLEEGDGVIQDTVCSNHMSHRNKQTWDYSCLYGCGLRANMKPYELSPSDKLMFIMEVELFNGYYAKNDKYLVGKNRQITKIYVPACGFKDCNTVAEKIVFWNNPADELGKYGMLSPACANCSRSSKYSISFNALSSQIDPQYHPEVQSLWVPDGVRGSTATVSVLEL